MWSVLCYPGRDSPQPTLLSACLSVSIYILMKRNMHVYLLFLPTFPSYFFPSYSSLSFHISVCMCICVAALLSQSNLQKGCYAISLKPDSLYGQSQRSSKRGKAPCPVSRGQWRAQYTVPSQASNCHAKGRRISWTFLSFKFKDTDILHLAHIQTHIHTLIERHLLHKFNVWCKRTCLLLELNLWPFEAEQTLSAIFCRPATSMAMSTQLSR